MFEIIYLIGIGFFALRTIFFIIGYFKEISKQKAIIDIKNDKLPFVSVIVPARNEEGNIKECILSISKNNYPIDKYEIIAINDRSNDDTGSVLDALVKSISNLRVIHNDSSKAIKNLQGKPGALQLAINNSSGDIFLMTDADCTVNQDWILTHAKTFINNDNLGLAAAYTNIKGDNLFSKVQAVEWLYMHAMAAGSIGMNSPLSCFGNNISVSRKLFQEIGGYENINFSITEDLALLQEMHRRGKDVRHLSSTKSTITTLPNKTLGEYLKQHHRWAVGAMALGTKAFLFVLSSLLIWAALVVSIINGDYIWSAAIIFSRILFDTILSIPAMLRLKRIDLFPYLIPSIFFFLIVELIAPLFLLKRNVSWKGQVFKERCATL